MQPIRHLQKNAVTYLAFASVFLSQNCRTREESSRDIETQIVGGDEAKFNQFPGVTYLPGLGCTACKISPRHFLTAQHCIVKAGAQNAKTLTFASGIQMSKLEKQSLEIRAIPLHKSSDLAIIEIKKDPLNWPHINVAATTVQPFQDQVVIVGYGCFERPMTLPSPSEGFAKSEQHLNLLASTTAQPQLPPPLLVPGLHFVFAMISDVALFGLKISAKHIQKTDRSLMPGLCPGDSGGPLLRDNKGVWEVVGVNSSFHSGTGESSFARIDKEMSALDMGNWLRDAMK
jgi:hypothetical protein